MYCRTQLVELQRELAEFEAAGVWVVAISYDPPGALAQFCDEHGITYPFLSDEGSRLIRQLGILNTLIAPDEAVYGIPYPGSYLLDERGVIVAKFFHREYQVREAPAFLLAEGFGLRPNLEGYPAAPARVEGADVEVVLGARDVKLQERVNLHVRVTPAAGWSLIEGPAVHVASVVDVQVGPPRYVSTEGGAETRIEVLSAVRDGETVAFGIEVACALLSPTGERVERAVEVRLEVPLGEMNRAQPAG